MNDYGVKGYAKGSSHSRAKLSASDISEIRELAKQGLSQKEIGERFGVHRSQISKIVNGKTGHLTENVYAG